MPRLSEAQKYHIVCILRTLASLNRNFELSEAIEIRRAGLAMDLSLARVDEALAEDFETFEQLKKRLAAFESDFEKKYLYQKCLLLLMADREISPEEEEMTASIRAELGLDEAYHQRVLEWVREGMEWRKRGEELAGGALED